MTHDIHFGDIFHSYLVTKSTCVLNSSPSLCPSFASTNWDMVKPRV